MDRARCYQQSDPTENRHFRRRWIEPALPPAPAPAPAQVQEPGAATVLAWVQDWRRRRPTKAQRSTAARA
jgi:hypothetical protein